MKPIDGGQFWWHQVIADHWPITTASFQWGHANVAENLVIGEHVAPAREIERVMAHEQGRRWLAGFGRSII
ncbi:MAG TPA: hypothetical protein VKU19_21875 [Bryobacteraceae bacterium]|nr:hypothetical protein [Bryobacteraceae bacterium]